MGIPFDPLRSLRITPEILRLVASVDEFRGRELSLTENHLLQLHGILLHHSTKDQRHRGHFKKLPNHVQAFGPDGKSLGVVFEAATPFDTPRLMKELVEWTRGALDSEVHHPLLLLRAGYAHVPFSSLERVVEQNKDGYYRALRRAQATLDRGEARLA